ncbi:hypothetical protein [Lacisediminihabitans sp. H27-G8]|uniref:hypothetical protein n=1 Tax=Lacisediminihabitans sp. H27-G8 TaxID=3111909 RepID=UPI0038FC6CE3
MLSVVAWFNLVSALGGTAGLTLGGGLGFPMAWIGGCGFTSYFWPSIILGVVVGGSQAETFAAQYGRFALAWALRAKSPAGKLS